MAYWHQATSQILSKSRMRHQPITQILVLTSYSLGRGENPPAKIDIRKMSIEGNTCENVVSKISAILLQHQCVKLV